MLGGHTHLHKCFVQVKLASEIDLVHEKFRARQEVASAHVQLRDQGAAAAAANANLEVLRQRCARLEMELAEAAAPQLQDHNMGVLHTFTG